MLLEIKSLDKSFGRERILKDVNISVNKGDIYGLIGPNGAGKTTIIKAILNLIKKDKGEVYFENTPINNEEYISKIIGATIGVCQVSCRI